LVLWDEKERLVENVEQNNERNAQNSRGSDSSRVQVAASRRVVVKLGTRVLVQDDGTLAGQHVQELVRSVARLTDVDAVYDRNPKRDHEARPLGRLDSPEDLLDDLESAAGSSVSRGGMRSKVEASTVAKAGGCQVVIASGSEPRVLEKIVAGNEIGTWIPADSSLSARRQWIGFAAVPRGVLGLDAGAVRALREDGASLLPVGVTRVDGGFQRGDVVELIGPDGGQVGRAWIDLAAGEVREWCRGRPPSDRHNCLVRRDDIVLGGE
jgi:glutamate 5-kinase